MSISPGAGRVHMGNGTPVIIQLDEIEPAFRPPMSPSIPVVEQGKNPNKSQISNNPAKLDVYNKLRPEAAGEEDSHDDTGTRADRPSSNDEPTQSEQLLCPCLSSRLFFPSFPANCGTCVVQCITGHTERRPSAHPVAGARATENDETNSMVIWVKFIGLSGWRPRSMPPDEKRRNELNGNLGRICRMCGAFSSQG